MAVSSIVIFYIRLFMSDSVDLNYDIVKNIDENNGVSNKGFILDMIGAANDIDEDSDVFFELYIPKINLKRNVYIIDSVKNNVDVNVELLDDSDDNLNLYFLASHSGGGRASYFNELVKLNKGDFVWIYKDSSSLSYVIDDIFYIDKNGYFNVDYGSSGNRIFLITCSLNSSSKQMVVTAKLVYSG